MNWRIDAGDWIRDIALAPDGKTVAVATASGEVVVVESETGRTLWRRPVLAGAVVELGFDPGGDSLVVAGEENTARVVSAHDGATLAELPGSGAWVESAAFSPRGDFVAIASGRRVRVWTSAFEPHVETEDHESTIAAMRFSPDGSRLATASYGGLHIWGIDPGAVSRHLPWKGSLVSLAWSPGTRVIACGTQECAVRFWRLASGQASEMNGYPEKPRELAWDAKGTLLATGGSPLVMLWSFRGKGPEGTRAIQLRSHEDSISKLVFSRDGSRLASGAKDGRVLVWDPREPRRPRVDHAIGGEISGVAWLEGDRVLVVSSSDGWLQRVELR
jgi:WD40 repeat protein